MFDFRTQAHLNCSHTIIPWFFVDSALNNLHFRSCSQQDSNPCTQTVVAPSIITTALRCLFTIINHNGISVPHDHYCYLSIHTCALITTIPTHTPFISMHGMSVHVHARGRCMRGNAQRTRVCCLQQSLALSHTPWESLPHGDSHQESRSLSHTAGKLAERRLSWVRKPHGCHLTVAPFFID